VGCGLTPQTAGEELRIVQEKRGKIGPAVEKERSRTSMKKLLLTLLALQTRALSLGVGQGGGGYVLKPRTDTPSGASLSFRVRVARPLDIPAIRNCNLATLPENYSDEFYRRHLSLWPRLAILAETQDGKLMGYTLGRVDTQPSVRVPPTSPPSEIGSYSPPQTVGHVASIAVYPQFRKMGIAKALMDMLHTQMSIVDSDSSSPVDTVSLHCRVSNTQAIRLYSGHFPYICVSIVPAYYEDNEDAWLMRLTGLQDFLSGAQQ